MYVFCIATVKLNYCTKLSVSACCETNRGVAAVKARATSLELLDSSYLGTERGCGNSRQVTAGYTANQAECKSY